jgi:1-deoxy-D-xylulose-5-phosphate reductoisomerase
VPRLDWSESAAWTFDPPDFNKFPLLKLAYQAQETGGSATAILNAADEIAIEAFLGDRIPFLGIAETVGETLSKMPRRDPATVGEVLEIDRDARRVAAGVIQARWGERVTTESAVRA